MNQLPGLQRHIRVADNGKAGGTDVPYDSGMRGGVAAALYGAFQSYVAAEIFAAVIDMPFRNGGDTVAVIAAACVRDFSATFTLFHELIFTNKLWLFDEGTDYMIRMLPEGFFSDMAFRILLTFGVGVIVLWILLFVWNYIRNRKNLHMIKNS